jgi:hypothetical protein
MTAPRTLGQLLERDVLAAAQTAIVAKLSAAFDGVTVLAHPGKVDLSELVGKAVVAAPGVGIGWSRVRVDPMMDGAQSFAVDWTAYIVAEAKVVGGKRVEKETVGMAIGARLLELLNDDAFTAFVAGMMPPEPRAELKPFFTIRDASQGTVYYIVTWSQLIADLGVPRFPQQTATVDEALPGFVFEDDEARDAVAQFLPALKDDGDA